MKITDRIYSVGILNPNMRVFDIVMTTDYGTSYNSYLIKGDRKNVLVEACHKTYFKQYLANIREVIDPERIDYVVLNHNEPDHSGSLAQLLEYIPNATIIASKAGSIYLKNITNRGDLSVQAAKDGDVIDIGGATLRFINAPFLHWPDLLLRLPRRALLRALHLRLQYGLSLQVRGGLQKLLRRDFRALQALCARGA